MQRLFAVNGTCDKMSRKGCMACDELTDESESFSFLLLPCFLCCM